MATSTPADAPATPPLAFVAYYRVSTDKQAASGLGLAAQRAAVRAWLQSHGYAAGGAGQRQLAAEFEEAESGRRSARPQLLRALAAARRHRAVLVVAKLDRLTRDPRFLGTLRDARVPFVAADNPHATELTVDILAAVAADEARRTAERTRAALAVKKARGAVLGRPANFTPGGRALGRERTHTQRRGRFLVWALAHGARVHELLASPYADGAPSLRVLGRALEAADVPTPSGRYEWHPTTTARILKRLSSMAAVP
jgi:DNA invertase Pin-like site-specific DNA recombinase